MGGEAVGGTVSVGGSVEKSVKPIGVTVGVGVAVSCIVDNRYDELVF